MKIFILLSTLFSFSFLSAQDSIFVDTLRVIQDKEKADSSILRINSSESFQVIDTPFIQSLIPKKKFTIDKVHIIFGLNYSYYNPVSIEKDIYRGPYYPVTDSAPVWLERNTSTNLAKSHRAGNFQFNLQANFWKGLFIGMNYQFFTINKYKKDPSYGNLLSKTNTMFFLVSASFGYVFEFLKNKCLQIEPSIRIGGFTADDYYDSGKGRKFYFGADCKIRYLIKRKFGISVGVDYDFIHYRKKDYSDIFQRNTYQKTTFSNVHLNAGICYNITIRTRK